MKRTTKRAPIYEDADGYLYEKINQSVGVRNPEAIREIVGAGEDAEVRWLIPFGTRHGSKAEADVINASNSSQVGAAKTDDPDLSHRGMDAEEIKTRREPTLPKSETKTK